MASFAGKRMVAPLLNMAAARTSTTLLHTLATPLQHAYAQGMHIHMHTRPGRSTHQHGFVAHAGNTAAACTCTYTCTHSHNAARTSTALLDTLATLLQHAHAHTHAHGHNAARASVDLLHMLATLLQHAQHMYTHMHTRPQCSTHQRGFVAHVRDVCASHAWRQGSQALCVVVDGLGQLQTFQVHPTQQQGNKGEA
eukprot:1162020-Pelagomonas_calceolata.AAC.19